MDPFEEFEFKPLTDGLGFHPKKKGEITEETAKKSAIEKNPAIGGLSASGPLLRNTINSNKPLNHEDKNTGLTPPLPKKSYAPAAGSENAIAAKAELGQLDFLKESPTAKEAKNAPKLPGQKADVIDELVRSFRNPKGQFEEKGTQTLKNKSLQGNISQSKEIFKNKQMKLEAENPRVAWSLMPFVVDAMMVLALSLISLIVALLFTEADLIGELSLSEPDPYFILAVLLVFVATMFSYTVGMRTFFGATLGEVVFDLQTGGNSAQQNFYPVRVFLRSLLVLATGLVTLPLISLFMQRDLAGELTGTELAASDS